MAHNSDRLANERRRLLTGLGLAEPNGLGISRFVVKCPSNAAEVLSRTKHLMTIVNDNTKEPWLTDIQWEQLMPDWFLARCGASRSQEEAAQWLAWWKSLPPTEQCRIEAETDWSLPDWLYWFQPSNRQWYWWDGKVLDANRFLVAVEVDAWPFAWGALRWMLDAAGAAHIQQEV